jgi:hypothetical protein
MILSWMADVALVISLILSVSAYVWVSRREGSYVNVMSPSFLINVPAYYFLPLFQTHVFGNEATPYAYIYVYATLALENVVFALAYARRSRRPLRLPFRYGYSNFGNYAVICLILGLLLYLPVLLRFPQYILNPRAIYEQTRTGFGVNFYISSLFANLAIIFVLFSQRSWRWKLAVILGAVALLSLHGSKGQVLTVLLLLMMFEAYVRRHKFKLLPSLLAGAGVGVVLVVLFAATMVLGGSAWEVASTISQYSDYTRNGMLVIDSRLPTQYGRLTLESNTIGIIPRVFMPSKPKNFGALYLDEQFYPEALDNDAGAPAFVVGVEYADFGVLAIAYLALFAAFKGWLARVFVDRLRSKRHPADFFVVAFLADITLIPTGAGWLLPEVIMVAMLMRFASCWGAVHTYRERFHPLFRAAIPAALNSGRIR